MRHGHDGGFASMQDALDQGELIAIVPTIQFRVPSRSFHLVRIAG